MASRSLHRLFILACKRPLTLSLLLFFVTNSRGQVDPTNPISILGGGEKDRDLSDRWYLWTVVAIVAAFFIVALFFVWRGFRNYRRYKRALEEEEEEGSWGDTPAFYHHSQAALGGAPPTIRIEGGSLLRSRGQAAKGSIDLSPQGPQTDGLHAMHAGVGLAAGAANAPNAVPAHHSKAGLQAGSVEMADLGQGPPRDKSPPGEEGPSAEALLRSVHETRAEVQALRSDLHTLGPALGAKGRDAAQQHSGAQQGRYSHPGAQYPLHPHSFLAQPPHQGPAFGGHTAAPAVAAAAGRKAEPQPHVHWSLQSAARSAPTAADSGSGADVPKHEEQGEVVRAKPSSSKAPLPAAGAGAGFQTAEAVQRPLRRSRSIDHLPTSLSFQNEQVVEGEECTKEMLRRMGLKRMPQRLPQLLTDMSRSMNINKGVHV